MASFATLGVALVARPFGSIIFGHFASWSAACSPTAGADNGALLMATILAVVWTPLMFPVAKIGSIERVRRVPLRHDLIGGWPSDRSAPCSRDSSRRGNPDTAAGFSCNAAQIIGGAIPPLVAAPIIASAGTFVFSLFLVALCLISLVSIVKFREAAGEDLAPAGMRGR